MLMDANDPTVDDAQKDLFYKPIQSEITAK